MIKDTTEVKVEADSSNQYSYLSGSNEPVVLKYKVEDEGIKGEEINSKYTDKATCEDKLLISGICMAYGYESGILTIHVPVAGKERVEFELPADLIKDALENGMNPVKVKLEATEGFNVESKDVERGTVRYAKHLVNGPYQITMDVLLVAAGNIKEIVVTNAEGSTGTYEVKMYPEIQRKGTIIGTVSGSTSFVVKVTLENGEEFEKTISTASYGYEFDEVAPRVTSTKIGKGNDLQEIDVVKTYTGGRFVVEYEFDEEIVKAPALDVYVGTDKVDTLTNGHLREESGKWKVTYEVELSISGTISLKLGEIEDLAGNVTTLDKVETNVEIDTKEPGVEIEVEVEYVQVGEEVEVEVKVGEAVEFELSKLSVTGMSGVEYSTDGSTYGDTVSGYHEVLYIKGVASEGVDAIEVQAVKGFVRDIAGNTNGEEAKLEKSIKVIRVVGATVESLTNCNGELCNEGDVIRVAVTYNVEVPKGMVEVEGFDLVTIEEKAKTHVFEYEVGSGNDREIRTITVTMKTTNEENTESVSLGRTITIDPEGMSGRLVSQETLMSLHVRPRITFVFEFDEEPTLADINTLKDAMYLREANGTERYMGAEIQYTGIQVNREAKRITVSVVLNASSITGEAFELVINEGAIIDKAGNGLVNAISGIAAVEVDNTKPTVSVSLVGGKYYYKNTETVTIAVSPEEGSSLVEGSQICLADVTGKEIVGKCIEVPETKEVEFVLSGMDGEYRVIVRAGLAQDEVGNPSEGYTSEVLFDVGSEADRAVVEIEAEDTGRTTKVAGVTYSYVDVENNELVYKLRVTNGRFVDTTESAICSKVEIYKDNEKVESGYNCKVTVAGSSDIIKVKIPTQKDYHLISSRRRGLYRDFNSGY